MPDSIDKYINTIVCGDCLDILRDFPDGCVDLVLTDPPYNIGFAGYDIYTDAMDYEEYVEMIQALDRWPVCIIQYPEEMMRCIVPALGIPDEVIAWCYNSNLSKQFRLINFYGIKPDYSNVVQPYKNLTDKRIQELIKAGSKGTPIYDWFSDIQIVKNVSEEKTAHPCPIPIALMSRLIILSTQPNDLILDPFCGSGTTCVAAKMLGRRYIGIDISPEYVEISRERLAAIDTGVPVKEARAGQGALFE